MPRKSKKKEKYITERVNVKGSSFEICIRAFDQTFRKTISQTDFNSRAEALQAACQIRDDALQKMRIGYTVSNFKTVSELYEKSFELLPIKIKTRKKQDYVFAQVIKKYGDTPIDKILSSHIQSSINAYARNHSAKDTSRVLSIWRRIYKVAALQNINVFDRTMACYIPECASTAKRKKDISSADLQKFCDELLAYNADSLMGAYRCRSVYYAIQIMRYCGLRPSETFALTRNDIHIEEGYISITKAVRSSQDEILTIGKTKTEQSMREVPIPPELKPILIECMNWARHELLFADYYGNLQDIDDIATLVRNVRLKAKVDFNLYMLRHQFSTDLMTQGTPMNIIRDLMGHESASMTLDYATSSEKDRINAISNRHFS